MSPSNTPIALELAAVTKRFGKTEIIRGVDLAVRKGERVAVIGPNGAGKSTLFNLISGRFEPSSGSIRLNGEDIVGKRPYEINRRGLARSFQITNIFSRLTVFENLRAAALYASGQKYSFWKPLSKLTELNDRTEALMASIELKRRRDVPASLLTYSEQRALEIGITIAGGANVILLDEPTAGMSPEETRAMQALLAGLPRAITILVIEHDMDVVFDLAERVTVLDYGAVLVEGTPAEIRASDLVRRRYLGERTQ